MVNSYLENIHKVDSAIEYIVQRMEELFPDGRTAYVMTADHGMSDKGSLSAVRPVFLSFR